MCNCLPGHEGNAFVTCQLAKRKSSLMPRCLLNKITDCSPGETKPMQPISLWSQQSVQGGQRASSVLLHSWVHW